MKRKLGFYPLISSCWAEYGKQEETRYENLFGKMWGRGEGGGGELFKEMKGCSARINKNNSILVFIMIYVSSNFHQLFIIY